MNDFPTKRLRVDIDQPRYNMDTYIGRVKHFFRLTNPLNILVSSSRLERAREVVTAYRAGKDVPYVSTMDDVWREKYLYDSAFHPVTGEKMFILGRMASQMPANTFLSTCMVAFYKSKYHVMFLQWLNQSFNAIVNYTNRSDSKSAEAKDLLIPYLSATFGALGTALSLKHYSQSMPIIFQRLIPFVAVAAANCVNLPMMRQQELKNGITLVDKNDNKVGLSRKAAKIGISQVVFSRVAMALPTMVATPVIMERLKQKGILKKYPKWDIPIQAFLIGSVLIFSTPLGCAFFRQKKTILVDKLEADVRQKIKEQYPNLTEVYYNKGL